MDPIEGKIRTRSTPAQSQVRVRCPECFKLYSVNPLEIREPKPKFDCVACQQRFWISYPECLESRDGVIGFPTEWLEGSEAPQQEAPQEVAPLQEKPFQCPKCTEPYGAGQNECFKCGVVFAKVLEPSSTSASRDLKDRWEDVIAKYELDSEHYDFIEACRREDALDYATQKYQGILEACAQDDRALKSLEQINALAHAQVQAAVSSVHKKSAPEVKGFRRLRVSAVLIFICGMLIAAGYLLPGFRNLMGLGVSGLFFVIALRYYFRFR